MSFVFRKLSVRGHSVKDANLVFENGLNVITGPSNTGKTYVFQCINYMLGASTPPKPILESKKYSEIFLEIETNDGKIYTLSSDLVGGAFKLYNTSLKEIGPNTQYNTLDRRHSSNDRENISIFLLGLNNLLGVNIRKDARGAKRHISYRDIVRFLLIDESSIITDKSVIISTNFSSNTEEENVFKFIITGQDDSNVVESLSSKQITHRKGKIELLSELINRTSEDLSTYSDEVEINIQLHQLEERIHLISSEHLNLRASFKDLENQRASLTENLNEEKAKEEYFTELLFRSRILNDQYTSDIDRLKATIEVSSLLLSEHTFDAHCPLCKSKLKESCNEDDILQVIESCELEIVKISNLMTELLASEKLMEVQRQNVLNSISRIQNNIDRTNDQLTNDVSIRLNEALSSLNDINRAKSTLYEAKFLNNKLQDLKTQKILLEKSVASTNTKFNRISTASVDELAQIIRSILTECHYLKQGVVNYSETKKDFVISGEDRELLGKGYRAIAYSIFIVGLQELIKDRPYSLGVPVLDSPFVTYKSPKINPAIDAIPVNLAMDFYRYVADDKKVTQVIILENEEPPADISGRINHVKFTQSTEDGRHGFFPVE